MCLSSLKKSTTLALALFLSACSANVDKAFENSDEFIVQIYKSGIQIREYKLLKNTEKYLKFENWARKNKWGWSLTPATYAPGVVVRGGGYVFNFVGESVVVNNPDGQYSKEIKESEYEFFNQEHT